MRVLLMLVRLLSVLWAIRSGRVGRYVARRTAYRASGRAIRRIFR